MNYKITDVSIDLYSETNRFLLEHMELMQESTYSRGMYYPYPILYHPKWDLISVVYEGLGKYKLFWKLHETQK